MKGPTLSFAAAVLLAAACASGAPPAGPARGSAPVTFTTLEQRSVPGQTGGKRREVIRDAAAWKAAWDEIRAGSDLPPEPPAVDFPREMVVLAAMPTQGCVSRVTIHAITPGAGGVTVDVLEEPPAPNCVCVVSARPFHAVKLRSLAGPARFHVERGETPCGHRAPS